MLVSLRRRSGVCPRSDVLPRTPSPLRLSLRTVLTSVSPWMVQFPHFLIHYLPELISGTSVFLLSGHLGRGRGMALLPQEEKERADPRRLTVAKQGTRKRMKKGRNKRVVKRSPLHGSRPSEWVGGRVAVVSQRHSRWRFRRVHRRNEKATPNRRINFHPALAQQMKH